MQSLVIAWTQHVFPYMGVSAYALPGMFSSKCLSMNTYSHYLKTTLGVNSSREPTLILKVYVPTIIFYAGFYWVLFEHLLY